MLKLLVIGLGPIGLNAARAVAAQPHDLELVGLVDLDPAKQGLTLSELAERQAPAKLTPPAHDDAEPPEPAAPGPRIAATVAAALRDQTADVALVTTTSRFDRMAPTLRELLDRRIAAVSSCEEMAYPWYQHAALADEIAAAARHAGRALLGTGVNPGFVMDSLAVTLSSIVRRVTAVRCTRRVDATLRRTALQAKVGATMKVEDFTAFAKANKIGHVGLAESVALIAAGLGRRAAPGSVQVALEPVLADRPIRSALGLIEPGRVAGIHNTAHWSGDSLTIDLDLTMACGCPDPKDCVAIDGPVPVRMSIPGGLQGDSATVAVLLNYARAIPTAPPGLHTMLTLPPAGCFGRDQ